MPVSLRGRKRHFELGCPHCDCQDFLSGCAHGFTPEKRVHPTPNPQPPPPPHLPSTASLTFCPSARIPDQPTVSASLIGHLNEMPHTGFTSQPSVDWPGTGISIPLFSETHCVEHITFWRVGTVETKTSCSDPLALHMQADLPRNCIPTPFDIEMER